MWRAENADRAMPSRRRRLTTMAWPWRTSSPTAAASLRTHQISDAARPAHHGPAGASSFHPISAMRRSFARRTAMPGSSVTDSRCVGTPGGGHPGRDSPMRGKAPSPNSRRRGLMVCDPRHVFGYRSVTRAGSVRVDPGRCHPLDRSTTGPAALVGESAAPTGFAGVRSDCLAPAPRRIPTR